MTHRILRPFYWFHLGVQLQLSIFHPTSSFVLQNRPCWSKSGKGTFQAQFLAVRHHFICFWFCSIECDNQLSNPPSLTHWIDDTFRPLANEHTLNLYHLIVLKGDTMNMWWHVCQVGGRPNICKRAGNCLIRGHSRLERGKKIFSRWSKYSEDVAHAQFRVKNYIFVTSNLGYLILDLLMPTWENLENCTACKPETYSSLTKNTFNPDQKDSIFSSLTIYISMSSKITSKRISAAT